MEISNLIFTNQQSIPRPADGQPREYSTSLAVFLKIFPAMPQKAADLRPMSILAPTQGET
jgi:hypothetical protein